MEEYYFASFISFLINVYFCDIHFTSLVYVHPGIWGKECFSDVCSLIYYRLLLIELSAHPNCKLSLFLFSLDQQMEFCEMGDSIVNHVVNHIFLPIKLPQKDDKSDARGGTFVRLVADVLALVEVEVEELKETKAMMKSWGMVQQDIMDWKAVHRNIEPGKTCAIFLPKQNAGLTVSIPADDSTATLAVFRVAARSSEVMGAPGVLSGTFPGWCVTTHSNRVRNSSFAE